MAEINWEHPDILKLSQEKITFLKLLSQELENVPPEARLSYILALNEKLKEQNIHFTTQEYKLLLNAVTGTLPPIFK